MLISEKLSEKIIQTVKYFILLIVKVIQNIGYKMFLKFLFVFTVMYVAAGFVPSAYAQDVKSFNGQYIYRVAGQSNDVNSCPPLPAALHTKVTKPGGLNVDELAYLAMGRGFHYLGVDSGRLFYSKKENALLNFDELILHMNKLDYRDPVNLSKVDELRRLTAYNNIPVLCGKQSAGQKAVQVAAAKKKARDCVFCDYPGQYYLTAIYEGDFRTQNRLASDFLFQITNASDASDLGVILEALAGPQSNFTFLEDVIGYYMLSSSRKWGKKSECKNNRPYRVRFTTTYPEQVYETMGGVSMGSDDAVTNVTDYSLPTSFKGACDHVCNKNGNILLTAQMAQGQSKVRAVETYKGISKMVAEHSCNSDVIKRFEANLLQMWSTERSQPTHVPRNTLGRHKQ
jgi:hypothetical protein